MDTLAPELAELVQACVAFVSTNALRVWQFFTGAWASPSSAFWLPYVGMFFVWAALAFRTTYGGRGFRPFLAFCFPREMYLSRSSATDVQVFVMNLFFRLPKLLLAGFGAPAIAAALLGLDWGTVRRYPLDPVTSLLFWAVWLLTAELGYYWAHRLYHRLPLFWEFHKVHHSAEVLTPITTFRTHPMFDMASALFVACIRGVILAGLVVAFGIQFSAVHLLGFNLFNAIFWMAGKHLRHSHIWWAWNPALSHVFLSPAQHQIHHSTDPKHRNKNYGEMLALWDWLFGSLYVPHEKEDLVFGLGEPHDITNGWNAYVMPFVGAGRVLAGGARRWVRPRPGAARATPAPGSRGPANDGKLRSYDPVE